MKFTDFFIKRPITAISVILLIVIFGIQSVPKLPIRQYPKIVTTIITVTTDYPGASQETMQAAVTSVLQKAIAGASDIEYISSATTQGESSITVKMDLNTNPNLALAAISAQVNSVLNELPEDIDKPVITESSGPTGIIYYTITSKKLTEPQIYSYINRIIEPQIQALHGVSSVEIFGSPFAFRIWLNPTKLKAMGLSATQVLSAIENNNLNTESGTMKGWYTAYNTNVKTTVSTAQAMGNLIVSSTGGKLIRLKDVAQVYLQRESDDIMAYTPLGNSSGFGINTTPEANPLAVANLVAPVIKRIEASMPPDMHMHLILNKTVSIRYGIHDVIKAILEAIAIVLVVIILFLGSLRSMVIPIVAIPISLIGASAVLLFAGFSYNLITLLAMIIAVGLVVDDAIVVVENIDRHLKLGETPFRAAIIGAREIATPIIAMTITLCSVFAPMALMGGLTGTLFQQFVATLIGAIILSGVTALVLSPVLSSKILKHHAKAGRFEHTVVAVLDYITAKYLKLLAISLNSKKYVVIFAIAVLCSIPVLFTRLPTGLLPTEDQGIFLAIGNTSGNRNANYVVDAMKKYDKLLSSMPQVKGALVVAGIPSTNDALILGSLTNWSKRKLDVTQIGNILNGEAQNIPSISVQSFPIPTINTGNQGFPLQFVMMSTDNLRTMEGYAIKLLARAETSGQIAFPQLSIKFNTGIANISINRALANTYGVTMSQISSVLNTYLSGADVTYNTLQGYSYPVIAGIVRAKRLNPKALLKLYVTGNNGKQIPLSALVNITIGTQPSEISNFNQMNSITLNGIPVVSIGSSINWLDKVAPQVLPKSYTYSYLGEARQYVNAGNTMLYAFLLAVGVVFLILSIQFESFRDALVILIEVPLAISGALLVLNIFNILQYQSAYLDLYTEMGLLALVGLISKHGILICEVAKQQQLAGKDKLTAITTAAKLRFRPVVMTTAAMIGGLVPLLYGFGPTTEAKFGIGLVLVAGLGIGTLFTLFILPVIYLLLGSEHKPQHLEVIE